VIFELTLGIDIGSDQPAAVSYGEEESHSSSSLVDSGEGSRKGEKDEVVGRH